MGATNGKYDDTIYVITTDVHWVKSIRIWNYSGTYSVQMRQNMDQNNSEYGYFSRNGCYITNANDFFPAKNCMTKS